jgi:hypothetical protein
VVFIGSGGEEEVTVAVPLPWRVVEVFAEPVMTVVESVVDVFVCEVAVAFWTIEVASEESDVASVILDVKVWYVPVGVACSVVDSVFVPVRNVRPLVLDEGSSASAPDTSKAHASPTALSEAILPSALDWDLAVKEHLNVYLL